MQFDLRETTWSHAPAETTVPKRRRIGRKLIIGGLLAGSVSLVALAAPAYAINDPSVPGDNCAPANAQAVGHPAFPVLVGTPAGAPGPGNSGAALEHNNANPNCVGVR